MEEKDIRVFYMMNGQILFAEFVGMTEDADYMLKGCVMVMIGQNKQIGMSTAYPFTEMGSTVEINRDHISVCAALAWNAHLCKEYDAFWAKVRQQQSGIEIVPANAVPPTRPVGPGLGAGQRPPLRTV